MRIKDDLPKPIAPYIENIFSLQKRKITIDSLNTQILISANEKCDHLCNSQEIFLQDVQAIYKWTLVYEMVDFQL